MKTQPLLISGLIVAALILGASVLARESSLNASTIRCLRYYGTAREQCMKQGSPTTRGNKQSSSQKAAAQKQNTRQPAAPINKYVIKDSDMLLPAVTVEDHIRGNPGAPVALIEYVDFECPFCKKHAATIDQLMTKNGDNVFLVVRHFPLPFHENASAEAEAAECAARFGGMGGFWKYHDALFSLTKSGGMGFDKEQLIPLGNQLGITSPSFESCIRNREALGTVTAQFEDGKIAGVSATPTTFIVNVRTGVAEKILGSIPEDRYQAIIDSIVGK
jgi:protein-disulfide isomerase